MDAPWFNFRAELITAVGPLWSVPAAGDTLPSAIASPAFLPSGKAPQLLPDM